MSNAIKREVVIGDCRLILGDCFDVLAEIGTDNFDIVISDPPYIMQAKGGGIGANRKYMADIDAAKLTSGFDHRMLSCFPAWAVFCSKKQIPILIEEAESEGKNWHILTWNKPNPTPLTNNNYLPDTEYIIHATYENGIFGNYSDKARFFVYPAQRNNTGHPTSKPLRVMDKIIRTASDNSQHVLDPFMGSGSTLISAIRNGRRATGIEIDEGYFNIACKRIEEAYKQPDMFVAPPSHKITQTGFEL